ncbi:hypothetical protein FKM82_012624 [Ascaphus truei]
MSSSKALQKKGHPNQQLPATPSITKRKQVQQSNTFKSPTDSLISPCSQRLLKTKLQTALRDQGCNARKPVPKCDIDGKENEMS